MRIRSTGSRYGIVTQACHWLAAILVVAAYFSGPGGSERRAFSAIMDATRQTHETLGLLVFGVVLFRIAWRSFDEDPARVEMAKWMQYSSRFVHLLLYALLITLPVTAIIGTWLEGHALTLLGVGNIGPPLSAARDVGASIMDIHTILGNVILWIAGVHAAAALAHHFLFRDRVLVTMLPGPSTSS